MNSCKHLYYLTVSDIQNVAQQELERTLTKAEIKLIEDNIGDYIKWYEAIALTISSHIKAHR